MRHKIEGLAEGVIASRDEKTTPSQIDAEYLIVSGDLRVEG